MNIGSVPVSAAVRCLAVCVLLAPVATAPATRGAMRTTAAARPAASAPADNVARMVGFEENRGQADARVRYLWRGTDATLFLTSNEAVLALAPGTDAVRMAFRGANPAPSIAGVDRLPGVSNYLVESADRWVTDVARFGAVRYRDLYPNVDLVMYGGTEGLEYDFVLGAGADAGAVALAFSGAGRATTDADGSLVLRTASGEVRHRAPRAYQMIDGERRYVGCGYTIGADGTVGFAVAGHDATRPLVIDPLLRFSTYLGGDSPDRAQSVALDAAGDIYLAGRTFSTDFPVEGAYQSFNGGNYDAFVTKVNAAGNDVVYSTYVGGSDFDTAQGVAVTAAGEAVFTGYTGSTNFPTLLPFQATLAAGIDSFVVRLNAAGNALVTSSYLGGGGADQAFGLALDAAGTIYVGGDTNSTNLATTVNAIQPSNAGGAHDGFYAQITSGGLLATLSYIGGAADDSVKAVAVDSGGNLYLTGSAEPGFPTLTPFQASAGGISAFLTKVNSSMTSYAFSSLFGGSNTDIGTGIAVDASGNSYLTGYTVSTNFPTVTPFQAANGGNNDGYVVKVNAAGTARVYASYIGGTGDDRGNAIAVDQHGSAYVVGQTRSTNFPVLYPIQVANGGNALNDVFVTKVGASGRIRIYSTYLGGAITDVANGVAVDGSLTAYVAGYSDSTNYPRVAPIQNSNSGVEDAILSAVVEFGDTPGVVMPGNATWFLRNSNSAGPADVQFGYGPAGTTFALAGDWNNDGVDTPGVYNQTTGQFFLRNSNTPGNATIVFSFGAANTYVPLAGDWNGDGTDSVGLYNPASGAFFLKNTNSAGAADISLTYGPVGASIVPVVGDWNGDGVDTIGVYDSATGAWFLRDTNSAGAANYVFTYGSGGLTPLAGDWNADGIDTPGLYDPASGSWFLRYTNSAGPADVVFGYGPTFSLPIVGDWNG